MLRNTPRRWGTLARALHWATAALIFVQFALGWTAVTWHLSPTKLDLFVWHKSLGLIVLVLAVLRILWRVANPTPRLPADTPRWERYAARTSHALLYVLMFAMPISGWVVNSAANVPFRVFWLWPLPALTAPDEATAAMAKTIHFALFIALAALVAVHVGAAVRHHAVRRDDVLKRMLPFEGRE